MIHFSPISSEQISDLVEQEHHSTAHPWTVANLLGSLRGKADCLLIQDGECAVGYLVVQRVLDEAELLNLVIFSPHGSKGFGYAALSALQARLVTSGATKLHLEVRASNRIARALYQKTGFLQTGLRPNYYRTSDASTAKEDAILMSWRLQ